MKTPKNRKPFLFRMTNRFILFLCSLSGALFFFYAAGNRQRFSDESQKLLLNCLNMLSALLVFFIFAGFVQITVYSIRLKTLRFIGFVFLYLVCAAFAVFAAAFAGAVVFFSA